MDILCSNKHRCEETSINAKFPEHDFLKKRKIEKRGKRYNEKAY